MGESNSANLRDILAAIYLDEPSIRRVVSDAGINEARIRFGTTAQNIWHSVLEEATKTQRLYILLEIANKEYATHEELQKACKEFDYNKKSKIRSDLNSPLAGGANEVKEWFLTSLHLNEQSLLLTTALFEDMSRHQLAIIAKDIEHILSTDN